MAAGERCVKSVKRENNLFIGAVALESPTYGACKKIKCETLRETELFVGFNDR